jgi:hypothetical protein
MARSTSARQPTPWQTILGVGGIATTAKFTNRLVQNLGNETEKLARFEGLWNEGHAPSAAQFIRVLGSCGAESNHGDSLRSGISFQAPQDVQPIEPRQVVVEKNQVRVDHPRHIETSFAMRGREYLIACPAEQSRHGVEERRIIVDDKNREGRGSVRVSHSLNS